MGGKIGHFLSPNEKIKGFTKNRFTLSKVAYGYSGCNYWLDAQVGLNTVVDLAAVSTWQPKIGQTVFQSTAGNQPRLVAADANFNNFPSVQFHDNARYMTLSNNFFPFAESFTLAFVAKYDTLNTLNTIISSLSGTPNILYFIGGSGFAVGIYDGAFKVGTSNNTNPKICIITNNRVMVNGVTETTFTSTIGSIGLNNLGRRDSTVTALIGRIAELLIYQQNLSAAQCLDLSTQLNSKYAIY